MQVIEYWVCLTGRASEVPFTTQAEAKRAASRIGQGADSVKRRTLALYESSSEQEEVNSAKFKEATLKDLTPGQKQALGLEQ